MSILHFSIELCKIKVLCAICCMGYVKCTVINCLNMSLQNMTHTLQCRRVHVSQAVHCQHCRGVQVKETLVSLSAHCEEKKSYFGRFLFLIINDIRTFVALSQYGSYIRPKLQLHLQTGKKT